MDNDRRRRVKLSHDPNNTAWTRSSSNFGQKLLLSQGWTPGSVLGASNASYTDSPASLSHVRITVKDDNLGLGARKGAQHDDDRTTGLDGLQLLLGRLNGKDQRELQHEQRSREDSRRAFYADHRWGFGNFVSGGFLVGDRIQHADEKKPSQVANVASSSDALFKVAGSKEGAPKTKKKKGQGRASNHTYSAATLGMDKPLSTVHPNTISQDVELRPEAKQPRTAEDCTVDVQRKTEKMERRARRKARKEEKAAAKVLNQQKEKPPKSTHSFAGQETQASLAAPRSVEAEQTHGRHAVRRRFIQHKKMSLTDQKALNEVCGFTGPFVAMLTLMIDIDDTSLVLQCLRGLVSVLHYAILTGTKAAMYDESRSTFVRSGAPVVIVCSPVLMYLHSQADSILPDPESNGINR